MEIEFDPTKDVVNVVKHGVSLAVAAQLDWDAALVWIDERYEYGELRMVALAPETQTLYYVAFVDRGEARRIISLRRATRREVKHYVENF
ncbi:MAG TPA: BrnT family toxin [Ideonella sp.]|uniref:BrnT family toxin n=1 Tax=Ideonella sp. TaxID=1929293 RepID=UPI002C05B81D|nr:BrnT family toxin [Ideonella sp.]HSI50784.1 BrnT family toxin [Ideonella sp.]